jgi:hypothetical protein
MLISAALELFAITEYYQTGDRYADDNVAIFDRHNLNIIAGEGLKNENGLNVQTFNKKGFALISSERLRLKASDFNELEWKVSGFSELTQLQFVWTTRRAPQQLHQLYISYQGSGKGRLKLADIQDWQGFIAAIGLRIAGELPEDFTVQQLKLKPMTPDNWQLLQRILQEWWDVESWNERSINFIGGGPPHGMLARPVPAAAAWVVLSSLLYLGFVLIRRTQFAWQSLIIFFAMGWLILDMRWQWNLWRQNEMTREIFAGKTWQEKNLAGKDTEIFQFAQEVNKILPEKLTRVFVISPDPNGSTRYTRLRLHYHLLPHNVYSAFSSLSDLIKLGTTPGDYLVILNPVNGLQYFQNRHELVAPEGHTPLRASLLYSSSKGYVFRVDS